MKKLRVLSLILLLFGRNIAAQQNSATNKSKPDTYLTPAGDKIVFLNTYYTSFLNAVKAGYTNKDSLFKAIVQGPILDNYFARSEYTDLVKSHFYYSIQDTTGLANYISSIQNSEKMIEEIVSATLSDANKILKNDSITIYILPSNNYQKFMIKRMRGVTAVTAGSKQILITIDTNFGNWKDMLKYTIAHEFDHTYWTKSHFSNSMRFTMLDYLCFEGRADSYAHLIYPDFKCPWTNVLADDKKTEAWTKIKPELQSEDQTLMSGVMFGSAEYPFWCGYTMGYSIVQSALKNHPELTPEQWANMEPEKLLEMSDYK